MLYGFLALAARDAMTRPVVTVTPSLSLAELDRVFEAHTFNSCLCLAKTPSAPSDASRHSKRRSGDKKCHLLTASTSGAFTRPAISDQNGGWNFGEAQDGILARDKRKCAPGRVRAPCSGRARVGRARPTRSHAPEDVGAVRV
jgi:hypothetical protein